MLRMWKWKECKNWEMGRPDARCCLHRMGLDQARSGWFEFQYGCGRGLGGPAPEKLLVVDGCRDGRIIFPWRCGFGRLRTF